MNMDPAAETCSVLQKKPKKQTVVIKERIIPHLQRSRTKEQRLKISNADKLMGNPSTRGQSTPHLQMDFLLDSHLNLPMTRRKSAPVKPSEPNSNINRRKMIKHGDTLHLAFSLSRHTESESKDCLMQLSGKLSSKVISGGISKSVPCIALETGSVIGVEHKIKIIGHSTKDFICGGDEISIMRSDKRYLRLKAMSNKLTFSKTDDLKSKFVVSGVSSGTKLTNTTNFYLVCSTNPLLVVGFLGGKDSSSGSSGCLATYDCEDNKKHVEPIQFFKKKLWNRDTEV